MNRLAGGRACSLYLENYVLTLNYGNSLFKTLVKMKIIPENTGQKVTHVKKKST